MEASERTSCINIDIEKVLSLQREGDIRVLRSVLTSFRLPTFNKSHSGPTDANLALPLTSKSIKTWLLEGVREGSSTWGTGF